MGDAELGQATIEEGPHPEPKTPAAWQKPPHPQTPRLSTIQGRVDLDVQFTKKCVHILLLLLLKIDMLPTKPCSP